MGILKQSFQEGSVFAAHNREYLGLEDCSHGLNGVSGPVDGQTTHSVRLLWHEEGIGGFHKCEK